METTVVVGVTQVVDLVFNGKYVIELAMMPVCTIIDIWILYLLIVQITGKPEASPPMLNSSCLQWLTLEAGTSTFIPHSSGLHSRAPTSFPSIHILLWLYHLFMVAEDTHTYTSNKSEISRQPQSYLAETDHNASQMWYSNSRASHHITNDTTNCWTTSLCPDLIRFC
jgi:hypothetical protein